MKLVRLISSAVSFAGLLLFAVVSGVGAESGRIAAVRLSPDLANLEVRWDGQVGRHSAQVLNSPNRLVIDLESAVLGKLPARIKVGRDSVDEIRLGQHDSRARLVIDFGQNPVPRFNVLRQDQSILVSLGKGQQPSTAPSVSAAANPAERPVRPVVSSSGNKQREKGDSRLSMKQAGVTKDGIVMDLADRKEPKREYRLNIDLDQNTLQVNKATFSDTRGKLKRSHAVSDQEVPVMTSGTLSPSVGPKKDWENSAAQPERRTRFKWGARTGDSANSGQPRIISRGPFKMNEYAVQRRSAEQ
jgi:hypothetical protein